MSTYREKLQQNFQSEYNQLNAHQKNAVDSIEGPVMVIAGPGTGKTQILAARIGKILLETDVQPENILCLTYTDAGAIAMRRRLLKFIGPDAYRVPISTFHSFCNEVIQENLDNFEKSNLSPVSELESIEIFKKLIDGLPKGNPLKRYRGDEYYEINNLKSLYSAMKREGWTPDVLNRFIDEYLKDLPFRDAFIYKRNGKDFKKGDIKKAELEEEQAKMEKLRAAVNEFDRYAALMSDWKRYDFDDMITWVIRAFEQNKNLLAHYQEQFLYVLVDEYQDTSGSQNRIVSLLVDFWEVPNIFVVGDDDQSIFRFQGANVENMMDIRTQFVQDIHTVVLTHNYRSSQPILDLSKKLIDTNEGRLIKKIEGLSKDLISAGDEVKHLREKPLLREYRSENEEMAGIVIELQKLIQSGVAPGRIAVIYREHKYGLELSRYLALSGIPAYSRKTINLLEENFSKKIITLLNYVSAELDTPYSGDHLLFEIMHFDFFQIAPIETAKLAVAAGYRNNGNSLRKSLFEYAHTPPKDLFDDSLNASVVYVSNALEKLIADAQNCSLQLFFERLINNTGILKYVLEHPKRHFLMQLLTSLFDFIKDETARNPSMDIHGIADMLEVMKKQKIGLPMLQVSGSETGVNLLTAHASKGLEFEYVFIAGAISAFWEKNSAGKKGYKLPDTIFHSAVTDAKEADLEEQRRLFYVALTRAEKGLFISYYKANQKGKVMEPSRFVAELRESGEVIEEQVVLHEEQVLHFNVLQFQELSPELEKLEEDFIGPLLEKFVMNVTALNNYLDCPLSFYYNSLLRIPSAKSEAAVFGSAIHYALEQLFKKMIARREKTGEAIFPPIDEIVEDFKQNLHWHREAFLDESFARRLEYGEEILKKHYEKYLDSWNTVALVELNVKGVVVDGVPLKGKIDKVEFNGKQVNVVDYKTGNPENAKAKLKGPDEKNVHGGNYWRQAVFYKLLLDNYKQKDWRVVSTEFDFIEPDGKQGIQKLYVPISDADITTVKQQVREVWSKIQGRDFYIGCGKADCHWCNFVKENNIAKELHEIRDEAED